MSSIFWKIGLTLLLGGGVLGWVKQHDSIVRWKALAEQRQLALDKRDQEIDAFKLSIEQLSEHLVKIRTEYRRTRKEMNDSVKALLTTITAQADTLVNDTTLTDIQRERVGMIVQACKATEARIQNQLSTCEQDQRIADSLSAKKDTLVTSLAIQRDAWMKEAKEAENRAGGVNPFIAGAVLVVTNVVSYLLGTQKSE